MKARPQLLKAAGPAICLVLATTLNFLAIGCGQKDMSLTPASIGNETHQPLTFYNPLPADGAAEIGERVSFGWQFDNPDNALVQYEVYMGTDSLIKVFGPDTVLVYTPAWGKQAQTKEMLVQIYEMQRAYRPYFGCYALNGICASATAPNGFFCPLGVTIDSQDHYTYAMTSGALTFSCTATGQLDYSDPEYDSWSINQDGKLLQILYEPKIEFKPLTEYTWQVVAIDSAQNRIESPIWHFTTTSNALYPDHRPITPCLPYPAENCSDIPLFDRFCWYAGSPADSLTYDFYLGLGENLQLYRSSLHENIVTPDWYQQKNMIDALSSILSVESDIKEQDGCYCGNGVVRLPGEWGVYDSTCLWPWWFHRDDMYTYSLSTTCSTFTVTAISNLDDDPNIDTWTVDQTGLIRCIINDADIPYRPHGRYSWKIVARDSHGNVIEGPLWHFTTNLQLETPF